MDSELINAIVSALWFLFVVIIMIIFYKPIRYDLLPKLTGFKAMGVEFSFVRDSINAAIKFGKKHEKWKVKVPKKDKEQVMKRAQNHLELFRNTKILWVDDHPEHNVNERRMFDQLNAKIDISRTTNEALEILKKEKYEIVISDIARDNESKTGLDFLKQFRIENKTTPVIFYVGEFNPELGVPGFAFGIAKRPDELVHLVLDVLERKKY